MQLRCFTLKHPSPGSKGLACLRFEGYPGEPYPYEAIKSLKRDWYFFWFSSWNYSLKQLPYNDLIDLFVAWDGLTDEIKAAGRTDCVFVRGGCETAEPHDTLFFPTADAQLEIDLLYVARFISAKRCDVALKCASYICERKPGARIVFLESPASEPHTRLWLLKERADLGLENNVLLTSVPLQVVNSFLNRARISLFTSDEEGMCRAVLQSLLAERPLLCYRHTNALTQTLHDDRFFNFYEEQTGESAGRAALALLEQDIWQNRGARRYLLEERKIKFHSGVEWRHELFAAAEHLYARDGQRLEPRDIVPLEVATTQFWQPFELLP